MRIAMLSYHTCPLATLGGKQTGGMNVYVKELTRNLGRQGISVDVFTRSQDDHVPHVLHDLGYGNRVVHIPSGPEKPLPNPELVQHISDFAQEVSHFTERKGLHYDLIHSHYWMSGIAAMELNKKWKVPFIQMFHTLGIMKNMIARSPDEREGNYREEGERKIISQADQIIVSTPAELSQLEKLYQADKKKISIIPPGVDTSHFYPIDNDEAKAFVGIQKNDRMILFVGRIEPLKGIDTLIQAFSMLKPPETMKNCPHYLVVIGGEPDATPEQMTTEMARLQNMVYALGIKDLVVFLGKRSQETLPYYYSAADVTVLPSHYESFGMVALEAMACGTPVIATEVGGLPYLVKNGVTGCIVPDNNPQALAEELTRLICNDDLREKMGNAAYAYAQDYSWEKITHQIIASYQRLLQNIRRQL